MAIQLIDTVTPDIGLKTVADKLNNNFTDPNNAASKQVVGTVSQSGGVPTGAIIQRGSNANGEFVRFADGTQIVIKKITGLDSPTADIRGSVTAASFIDANFITQVTPQDAFSDLDLSARKLFCIFTPDAAAGNPSATTLPRIIINTGGSTNVDGAHITAIGRWF